MAKVKRTRRRKRQQRHSTKEKGQETNIGTSPQTVEDRLEMSLEELILSDKGHDGSSQDAVMKTEAAEDADVKKEEDEPTG